MLIDTIPSIINEQIEFINENYTLNLSMHLPSLQHLKDSPEGSIALSKVYFSIGDYESSIDLILRNKEHFVDDGSFFYQRIIYHIFNNYEKYSEFIQEYMKRHPSFDDENFLKEYGNNLIEKENITTNKIDNLVKEYKMENLYKFIMELEGKEQLEAVYYIYENFPLKRSFIFEILTEFHANVEDKKILILLDEKFHKSINLYFLLKNNKTDFNVLRSLNKYNNKLNALLMNGIFNLGTSNDSVYRETKGILEVSGWSKFIGIGFIGCIHKHFSSDPYNLLRDFLPSDVELKNGAPLFSIGIIRQNNVEDRDFALNFITDENLGGELLFGAMLGLGLNALGTGNDSNNKLVMDKIDPGDNITKEGGLIALGLINLGTGNKTVINYLEKYYEDESFDRIKRNAGIGIALIYLGHFNEEIVANGSKSDTPLSVFVKLLETKDSIQKYSATLILGSAYFATGNLSVIKMLLKCVSDGNEDVRRAAIFSIGMIAAKDDRLLIEMLLLMSNNHCPRVRGSVAFTLGAFLSGKSSLYYMKKGLEWDLINQVIDTIEVMLYDNNNLVIQQACIGMGMLIIQSNSTIIKNYKRIVERINSLCLERDDNSGVKIGACIGRSFLGLAGETGVISVLNHFNRPDPVKMMGMLMFFNYYFYYQFIPFISHSVSFNGLIVLTENLKLQSVNIKVDEKRSKFESEMIRLPERKQKKFKRKEISFEYVVEEEGNYVLENNSKISYGEMVYLGRKRMGLNFD